MSLAVPDGFLLPNWGNSSADDYGGASADIPTPDNNHTRVCTKDHTILRTIRYTTDYTKGHTIRYSSLSPGSSPDLPSPG